MKNSLSRFVRYVGIESESLKHEFDPQTHARTFSFLEEISSILDKEPLETLLNTAVIIDISDSYGDISSDLNPISSSDTIGQILSSLILSYPEVFWIILGTSYNKPSDDVIWAKEHFIDATNVSCCIDLLKRHQDGYSPLFDASGLRSWLKHITKNKVNKRDDGFSLPPAASAIDEEEAYAYLHSYIAYRMGYRCYPVTTLSMMKGLFESSNGIESRIDLVFEDIFLNFPDKDIDTSLSDLKKRDSAYSRLKDVNKRVFVTVGHGHIDWYDSNREYIKSLKGQGKRVEMVYKPSGGIYNLLEKGKLRGEYWKHRQDKWSGFRENAPEGDRHSTPGRLLEISEVLINRVERLYYEAKTVEECIYGAILASEAVELLDYRTPTTCLEAIALRHKLEVKAECMFYGVEYNIDVKNRLKELKGEINAISRWFNKSVKEKSSLNAQMMIVTEIMKIFREHGQFDEEQECMKYFRMLNRRWYFKRHPYFILFKPFRLYFDTLIGNFRYFLIAILLLPLIFGIISYVFNFNKDEGISNCIANAYFTFYGLQPVKFPESISSKVTTVILIFAGFSHLGIFISYLFTILSRRN